MTVTIYTKPECHLCDDLKADLHAIQQEIGFVLVESNIEDDPGIYDRFKYLIPVLDIPTVGLLYPPHDWLEVHQTLIRAIDASSNAGG